MTHFPHVLASHRLGRRAFLAGVGASAMASGAAAQTPSLAPSPASDTAGETASLAAGNNADRMTVEVLINGAGPFHFIVDTGAEKSVVSTEAAEQLGLRHGPTVLVDGLVRRISAVSVHVADLSFGPFRRSDLRLPVLPRAMMGCDGFLGLDAILGTRVTFNFRQQQITFERSKKDYIDNSRRDATAKVQMTGDTGYLRTTDCWVEGVAATAFIDTGAEYSMGNALLMDALRERRHVPFDMRPIVLTGVTGGQVSGSVMPVRIIRLQDLTFTEADLAIVDVPNFSTWSLDNRPALLIGMNFLRQFGKVRIDYRTGEVRFELAMLGLSGAMHA